MRYRVLHNTSFQYASTVSLSHHLARQTPRDLPSQQVLGTKITCCPNPSLVTSHEDFFGNTNTFITVEGPHREFALSASSLVEVRPTVTPDPVLTPPWDRPGLAHPTFYGTDGRVEQFAFASRLVPVSGDLADYARESFLPGTPVLEAGVHLMGRIHADFVFDPRATTVSTPVDEVFRKRRGVCQDFAHLGIACLRSLGLPARYISGYLETLPPPGKTKLVGADASHAWLELWCGHAGWVGLDPTNNLVPSDRHIIVACGKDYTDVSPLRGVLVGGERHTLRVAVDVTPV